MSIAAKKINKDACHAIIDLIYSSPWLKKQSDALMDLWNLCNTGEQQSLLSELFDRFTFINSEQLEEIAKNIVKFISNKDITSVNTYIIATADSGEVDGSTAGIQYLKNKFPSSKNWTTRNFYTSINDGIDCLQNKCSIILFDDFIGTGKTIIRKVNFVKEQIEKNKIKPQNLFVISFAAMEFGVVNIKENTGVDVYTPKLLKKGITDFESPDMVEYKKQLMLEIENNLSVKFKRLHLSDHNLGYLRSEALFQIQGYNCPNNVFPIFWWPKLNDGSYRETIFKRAAE